MASTPKFQVEKNVPLPMPGERASAKYPWRQMDVGDSFFVPGVKASKLTNASTSFVHWARKRENITMQFAARTVEGGARIWRVA